MSAVATNTPSASTVAATPTTGATTGQCLVTVCIAGSRGFGGPADLTSRDGAAPSILQRRFVSRGGDVSSPSAGSQGPGARQCTTRYAAARRAGAAATVVAAARRGPRLVPARRILGHRSAVDLPERPPAAER